jgi:peptidoglycan hydrolase CwlO-like protein
MHKETACRAALAVRLRHGLDVGLADDYGYYRVLGDVMLADIRRPAIRILSVVFAALLAFGLATVPALYGSGDAWGVPTQADVDAAQAKLSAMQANAAAAAETYNENLDAHDTALKNMKNAKEEIDDCTQKINTKQNHLGTRVNSMYRNGSLSFVDVLLGCTSFTSFLTTWSTLSDLNDKDAALISDIKDLKTKASAAHTKYKEQEKQAATEMAAAKRSKSELDSQVSVLDTEYQQLSADLQAAVAAANRAALERERAAAAAAAANDEGNGGSNGGGNSDNGGNGGGNGSDGGSGGYVDNGGSSNGGLAARALTKVGCEYSYGAAGPDKFDCSGLVYWASGGSMPRSSSGLYSAAKSRLPVSQAQYGDVLWTGGHVGISLGGNSYVHASTYGVGVIVSNNASSAFTYALRF